MEDSYKTGLGGGQRITLAVLSTLQKNNIRLWDSTDLIKAKADGGSIQFSKYLSSGKSASEKPSFSFPLYEPLVYGAQSAFNLSCLLSLAIKEKPAIIYCAHKKPLMMALLLKKLGVMRGKIIFHAHSVFPQGKLAGWVKDKIEKNVDLTLCPSKRIYTQMNGCKALIYNPLPQSVTESLPPRHSSDRIRVAFVGSLLPWKGIDFFYALAEFFQTEKKYEFRVYTHDRPSQPSAHVTYYFDKVYSEIYSDIDILAICSRGEESFSLTALEASINNIPVIFPAQPALCEILTPGISGEMYTDADVREVGRLLAQIGNNPMRYQSRTQQLLEKYSYTNFEKAIQEIFSQ